MADQNSKPSLFGNTGTSQSGGFGFGNASTGTPSGSGGLFGSGASSGGSSLFGNVVKKPEDASKPAPATTSLFGNLSTPSKPGTPNPGLATTPANAQTGPGNASTTPIASPPPAGGILFGQSFSSGPSAFGNLGGKQEGAASAAPAANPFAAASNNTPKSGSSLFGGQTNQTGSSLFGGAATGATSNMFGQRSTQDQAPQAQNKGSASLFGGAPAAPSGDAAPKPNLFGGPSASGSGSSTPAKSLFGAAPASTAPQQPTTNAPTSSNLFEGAASTPQASSNPFGGAPKTDTAPPTTQPGSTSAPSASLFGTAQAISQEQASQPASSPFGSFGKPAVTSAPTSSQPAGTAPLFGATTTSSQPATSTSAAAVTSAPSTTSAPSQSNAPTASSAGATNNTASAFASSTAGPTPTPQSRLKNKTMDEIITRWATDLKKYQKEFQTQADKVAQWDRLLVENSNAITKLYSRTFQAERDTSEVQKQLSAVEDNQAELSQWLDRYEQEVEGLMAKEGMGQREGLQGPDQERERTYKAAERVQEKLSDMGNELTGLIEEINSVSSSLSNSSKPDDPLSQIVRILNTHLSQLQQIDQDTAALQAKVAAAKAESQRLGYRSNGISSAADDFYRSLRSAR